MPDELPETKFSKRFESLLKMIGGVTALFYAFGYLSNGLYLANYGIPSAKIQNVLTGFLFILFLVAPVCVFTLPVKLASMTKPPNVWVDWAWRIAYSLRLDRWWLKTPASRETYLNDRLPRVPIWLMFFLFCLIVITGLLDTVLNYDSFIPRCKKLPLPLLYLQPWVIYKPSGSLLIPEGEAARILLWFWFFGLVCFFVGASALLYAHRNARWPWILIIGGAALSVHYYTDKVHPRWEASLGGGFYGFYDIKIKQSAKSDGKQTLPDDRLVEFFRAEPSDRILPNQFVVFEDDSSLYIRPSNSIAHDIKIVFPKIWESGKVNSEETTDEIYAVRIPKDSIAGMRGVLNKACRLPWTED